MEIKINCACGTNFKFDVEPVNGRMPVPVACPACNADSTAAANAQIAQQMLAAVMAGQPAAPAAAPAYAPAAAPAPPVGLRVAATHAAPPPSSPGYGAASAPRSLLQRNTFFVKERVAVLKLTDTFDIYDPVTNQLIGIAREEPPVWAKWLRLLVNKKLLPTSVNIYEGEGQPPVVSIHRGFTFIRSKIRVVAGDRTQLGFLQSKFFSIGGGFNVLDNQSQPVAEVKGNWKGWDFKFISKNGREIGTVTKKWAGLGKELFTSADNYIISLTETDQANPAASALLLAAGISIDIVFKEKN